MDLARLIYRNIERSGFRSWLIFLFAALMSGFTVSVSLLVGGASQSIRLAQERLGADIIVIPAGYEQKMENAFLMGAPTTIWMPRSVVDGVAKTPGVAQVSPQMFLATLVGAHCCAVPEMFLVAYEPGTDFTLRPWLERNLEGGLGLGQVVGGSYVFLPEGAANILIYGVGLNLKGNLASTGTGLDQTMFFTFETAQDLANQSYTKAEKPLVIPPNQISSVMVRLQPGADPQKVARQIETDMPYLRAVRSNNLFRSHQVRMGAMIRSAVAILVIIWLLSVILIGLVFSLMVGERQREIGVLRAIGATRPNIFASLLAEALLFALFGGAAGAGVGLVGILLARSAITAGLNIPFLTPSLLELGGLLLLGFVTSLITVVPAVLIPTLRITLMDPIAAMRK
jgi:putative ABC transport system permease protein